MTRNFSFSDVPGYAEALRLATDKDEACRAKAWTEPVYDIHGFKLRQMTVQDFFVLSCYASPFLNRIVPTIESLSQFLWTLKPDRAKTFRGFRSMLFGRKVGLKLGANIPEDFEGKPCFQSAVAQCFEYMDEIWFESPASVRDGKLSHTHYLTSWFDFMMGEYMSSEDQIWPLPLPRLFALMASHRGRNNPDIPSFSRRRDELNVKIARAVCRGHSLEDFKEGRLNLNDLS